MNSRFPGDPDIKLDPDNCLQFCGNAMATLDSTTLLLDPKTEIEAKKFGLYLLFCKRSGQSNLFFLMYSDDNKTGGCSHINNFNTYSWKRF